MLLRPGRSRAGDCFSSGSRSCCSRHSTDSPFRSSPHHASDCRYTLSALQAVIFLGFGLLWPKLNLGPRALRVAFWCAVYSALAILAAYVIAAIWGVGNETIKLMGELPHGLSHGSAFQRA